MDLGIWDHIVRRYADTGYPEVVRACETCYAELAKLESEEVVRAIRGENYETIWGQRGVAERVGDDDGPDLDEDEGDVYDDEDL